MAQATFPTLEPSALTDSLRCCVAGRPGPSRTSHQARANPGRRAETLRAVCTHVPSPRPARAEAAARLQCGSGPHGLTGSAEGDQGLGGSCAKPSTPAGCSEDKEGPVRPASLQPVGETPGSTFSHAGRTCASRDAPGAAAARSARPLCHAAPNPGASNPNVTFPGRIARSFPTLKGVAGKKKKSKPSFGIKFPV